MTNLAFILSEEKEKSTGETEKKSWRGKEEEREVKTLYHSWFQL